MEKSYYHLQIIQYFTQNNTQELTLEFFLRGIGESSWSSEYEKLGNPFATLLILVDDNLLGILGIYAANDTGSTSWPKSWNETRVKRNEVFFTESSNSQAKVLELMSHYIV